MNSGPIGASRVPGENPLWLRAILSGACAGRRPALALLQIYREVRFSYRFRKLWGGRASQSQWLAGKGQLPEALQRKTATETVVSFSAVITSSGDWWKNSATLETNNPVSR